MTDTPRTDKVVKPYIGMDGVSVDECNALLNHARQLERELNEALRWQDDLHQRNKSLREKLQAFK